MSKESEASIVAAIDEERGVTVGMISRAESQSSKSLQLPRRLQRGCRAMMQARP